MQKYSGFGLLKHALTHHENWQKVWQNPTPRHEGYDVIIVGGGGHGLATAYYLAKEHGITNVAVIEKGYLGGGTTPTGDPNARYSVPHSAATGRINTEIRTSNAFRARRSSSDAARPGDRPRAKAARGGRGWKRNCPTPIRFPYPSAWNSARRRNGAFAACANRCATGRVSCR